MALGLAVLLAAGAALAQTCPPDIKYEATAIKRELNATSFYPLMHFIIPDGQCTGVLDSDVIPSWCVGVNGISVVARDRSPPALDIASDLQSAVVRRREDGDGVCAGVAAVKMKVSCRDLAADVPSYIRSSATDQNWPEPVKKPPGSSLRNNMPTNDASQEENQRSSTENPPEPLRGSFDLHSETNKAHIGEESARKPLRPMQHNRDLQSRANKWQHWQEFSKMRLEPVNLRHNYDFNLYSGESKNRPGPAIYQSVQKPLLGGRHFIF